MRINCIFVLKQLVCDCIQLGYPGSHFVLNYRKRLHGFETQGVAPTPPSPPPPPPPPPQKKMLTRHVSIMIHTSMRVGAVLMAWCAFLPKLRNKKQDPIEWPSMPSTLRLTGRGEGDGRAWGPPFRREHKTNLFRIARQVQSNKQQYSIVYYDTAGTSTNLKQHSRRSRLTLLPSPRTRTNDPPRRA